MILEFSSRWPFVRRHTCKVLVPIVSHPVAAHQSWVKLRDGRVGWLHHHEKDGWWVAVGDSLIQTNDFVNR